MPSLLGIDNGLTVTKAVIFDADGTQLAVARRRVPQLMPHPRFVERDMAGLWRATAEAIARGDQPERPPGKRREGGRGDRARRRRLFAGRRSPSFGAWRPVARQPRRSGGRAVVQRLCRARSAGADRPGAACVCALGAAGLDQAKRAGSLSPDRACARLQGLAALLPHRGRRHGSDRSQHLVHRRAHANLCARSVAHLRARGAVRSSAAHFAFG